MYRSVCLYVFLAIYMHYNSIYEPIYSHGKSLSVAESIDIVSIQDAEPCLCGLGCEVLRGSDERVCPQALLAAA